jgi:hypothetical protein
MSKPTVSRKSAPKLKPKKGDALRALVSSSFDVVEAAGLEFRIEAITSRDMLYHTSQYLLHLPAGARDAMANNEPKKVDLATLRPEDLARSGQVMEAIVCAGVRGVRVPGADEWDDCTLAMNKGDADDETRLWVGRLPPAAVQSIALRVFALSGNNGRAAEAIASFRGESGSAEAGRQDRAA